MRVIANRHNPGFAGANNQALAEARGRFSLLLNPDTVVLPDGFGALVRFMDEHPRAGAALAHAYSTLTGRCSPPARPLQRLAANCGACSTSTGCIPTANTTCAAGRRPNRGR